MQALSWREVEVGANPGCEEESFEDAVAACREALPALSIVWRATDIQSSSIIPKFPAAAAHAQSSVTAADGVVDGVSN